MDKIWEANAVATAPATPGTSSGYPSDGDIDTGAEATIPGAYWFWMITAELLALITGAGMVPNGSSLNQVFQAVQAIANAAVATALATAEAFATAAANAAQTAAEAFATAAANAAQTAAEAFATAAANAVQATVLGWFTGSNQSLGAAPYQKLPGGWILQCVRFVPPSGGNYLTVTLPTTFTTTCFAFATTQDATDVIAVTPPAAGPVSSVQVQNGGGTGGMLFAIGY